MGIILEGGVIVANKNDNLIPQGHKLTLEEQKMGGRRSAEVRREKATMKKTLEMMLDEVNKKSGKTYRELATLGLIKGAVKGNAVNYRTILELTGELNSVDNSTINENILNIANLLNNPVKNRTEKDLEDDNNG